MNLTKLVIFRRIKIVQIILSLVSNILILVYLDELAKELAEFISHEFHEEQNLAQLTLVVRFSLRLFSVLSIVFWLTFQMHAAYLVSKLMSALEEGLDPDDPQIILMIPLNSRNEQTASTVHYETPSLHGHSTIIPVALT